MKRILVETDFLIALNPRDHMHRWALNILEGAREGRFSLYLSGASIIEISLILRSRGGQPKEVAKALEAFKTVISGYTRLYEAPPTMNIVIRAHQILDRYGEATFFDALHAATALEMELTYAGLDDIVKNIVVMEGGETL